MTYSCSDFTDDMLALLVDVGAVSPDDIAEDDPERQYEVAAAAVRSLATGKPGQPSAAVKQIVQDIKRALVRGRRADLNGAVHDAACFAACVANKGGLEAQVAFLLGCGSSAAEIVGSAL